MADANPIHPQDPKPNSKKPVKAQEAVPAETPKGVPLGTHDAMRYDA